MSKTQFEISLQGFAEKTKGNMDLIVRKVASEVLSSVVFKSPVDTGRFRGAWVVNDTEFAYAPGAGPRFDATGALALQDGDVVIQKINAGQTVVISNNLPYGERLENGWSDQAPLGIVAITVIEFNMFMREVLAAVRP